MHHNMERICSIDTLQIMAQVMGARAASNVKNFTASGVPHLGQAELHAGDMRRDRRHVHAQCLSRVEHARAVQVDGQALRGMPSQISLYP